jgi:hypothetical protein
MRTTKLTKQHSKGPWLEHLHLPPKLCLGGSDAENLAQSPPQINFSSGMTHFFLRRTRSKPYPRGASGGAGWARDFPCGPHVSESTDTL